MKECSNIHVGLDVHKETISVGVLRPGEEKAVFYGVIEHSVLAVGKLVKRLSVDGEVIDFCYEAGSCGYGLYRQLTRLGHRCKVVAPSLIPRKAGDRMKTDRRDALKLGELDGAGLLTAVWVPDEEQESMRDLTRAREDMKSMERCARQRLGAFLLRHGWVYGGKSRWTKSYFRWLSEIRCATPVQQVVLQEYIDAVRQCSRRVGGLELQMREALSGYRLRAVVQGLMALRGMSLVSAMTTVAELGDLTRFASPRDLMGYLGMVPSEHSSGPTRRQGGITRTGNGHVRRILVEAAWNYRFSARKSRAIQQRAEQSSEPIQAIAWQAQKRLCGRYRALTLQGKNSKLVTTAVARELVGFIWAIACEASGKAHGSKALA